MKINDNLWISVSFSLFGKAVDPEEIYIATGTQPTDAHKRGEPHGDSLVWENGFWDISSDNEVKSEDLRDHLIWVLDRMDLNKSYFQQIMKDNTIVGRISCLYQSNYGHEDFVLPGEILYRLAQYPLKEFSISAFFENKVHEPRDED